MKRDSSGTEPRRYTGRSETIPEADNVVLDTRGVGEPSPTNVGRRRSSYKAASGRHSLAVKHDIHCSANAIPPASRASRRSETIPEAVNVVLDTRGDGERSRTSVGRREPMLQGI
jgi:hypothetical protein